ncbi:flagellar hook-associated protein FlgL [Fontimonas sp. SYSU GA230001]|uniref:flagellar hook-associated protein FlgL n=1 Tax=Fontimonas sp. SYSU GA230001 TaxID=3142450 RepID=UPI0032B4E544
MRVSTAQLHQVAVSRMQSQQQALLRVQTQLSSQQKYLAAGDAPADWAAGLGIEQLIAQNERFKANASTARHRLALEENALGEGIDILRRVKELTIQANSGSQSDASRATIAQELRGLRDAMLGVANRDDGQGRYIFAGTNDGNLPFSWNGSSLNYGGDQQVRQLQIGNARSLADGDPGSEVFQRLRNGNGTIQVSASTTNTGGISLKTATIYDAAQYDGDTYTVSFIGGNYEVYDSSSTLVDSGPYTAGTAIRVRGFDLNFANDPVDGDSFTVAPSQQQDVVALIDRLANIIAAPQTSPAERGIVQTGIQQGLMELDRAEVHLLSFQTSAGIRLGNVEDAENTLDAATIDAQSTLSGLRDLDIAEAATRLQQQLLSLQAAQAAYVKVQGLSLFNYL